MYRDYYPKGVEFLYVYKSLAHPELNGYVQPFTLEERLMHVKEAQRTLGSQFTWICDDMDNDIKEAFGNRPNSEFIIDPEGKIVRKRSWSSPEELRRDLEELVGPVENPTRPEDVRLKTAEPPKVAASGVVPRKPRPDGARPVVATPKIVKDGQPFYVKLRAEATESLMRGSEGQLYLGFHLDPLYHVHWNNLVDAITVTIEPSEGVEVSKTELKGPKVEKPSDIDPREFIIDVKNAGPGSKLELAVHYFACNDEEGWCKPVSQRYTVTFERDPHGGSVMGGRRGGGRRAGGAERMRRMFVQRDVDKDGKLSPDEVTRGMREMFDRIDADGDGYITFEEMQEMQRMRRGRGGGGGRRGGDRGGG